MTRKLYTLFLFFFVFGSSFQLAYSQSITLFTTGFNSSAENNHRAKLFYQLKRNGNWGTEIMLVNCAQRNGFGNDFIPYTATFNIPVGGVLPEAIRFNVEGWEEGANDNGCQGNCSYDENSPVCSDKNHGKGWEEYELNTIPPGISIPINSLNSNFYGDSFEYGLVGSFYYTLPNNVLQAPLAQNYSSPSGNGHCYQDLIPDNVDWAVNPLSGIPSVSGMSYEWQFRIAGGYTAPVNTTCYNTCKIDSVLTTDCVRYGPPIGTCYGADPITGELIEIPCDPICLKDTTYYAYTYDYFCNPYPCTQPQFQDYTTGWVNVYSSPVDNNGYSVADVFALPNVVSSLSAEYNRLKYMLNGRIEFRVRGVYGGGAYVTGYSNAGSVRVNWPPAATLDVPVSPTSMNFNTLSEAIYASSQVRVENAKCFGTNSGKIVITGVTGQAGNYYFSLKQTQNASGQPGTLVLNIPNKNPSVSSPAVFPDDAPNALGMSGLPAGLYDIYVENYDAGGSNGTTVTPSRSGCFTLAKSIKIQEPTRLEKQAFTKHTYNGFNVSCKGSSDGRVSISAKGGVMPYTYELIEDSPVFSPATTVSGATSSPFEFSGLAAKDVNGNTINYTIKLRDALGVCVEEEDFTLSEPAAPVEINNLVLSQYGTYNIPCFGGVGQIQVLPKGGVETASYTVQMGSLSQTATTSTVATFSNVAAGTYNIIISDANGCEKIQVVTLTEPPRINPTNALVVEPTCYQGKDAKIESEAIGGVPAVGGAYTFSLQRTAGNQPNSFYSYIDPTPQSQTKASFLALPEGTYRLRIQDQFSCQKDTTIIILEPASLASGVLEATRKNVSCKAGSDGEMQVRFQGGSAPYQIEWSYNSAATSDYVSTTASNSWGGTVETVSLGVTETHLFKNLKAGTYYLRFKDSKNCDNNIIGGVVTQFTITEPNIALDASISFNSQVSCFQGNDGSVTAFATGGWVGSYQFALDGGAYSLNNVFPNLSAGNHTISVRDSQGCIKTVNFVITQPDQLTANLATSTNTSCFGGSDGTATLNISGGTSPYKVSLDNGATWVLTDINTPTATLSNLSAGTYNISVSDANNCTASSLLSVVISEPSMIAFQSAPIVTNTSCGQNDGAISVSITGGTPNYTYAWERLQGASYVAIAGNTSTLSNIFAGTYRVKITDNRGCQWTSSAIAVSDIGSPDMANLQTTPVSCFGGNDGTVSFEVTSGTAPYEWRLQGVTNFAPVTGVTTLTGLRGGASNQHVIEIKGANGCVRPFVVEIQEPAPLSINFTPQNPLCIGASNGNITATVSGGNGGYIYEWTNFSTATTATLSGLAQGTYTLKVKDSKGCEVSKQISLSDPLPTKVNFPDIVQICGGNAYTVDAGNVGSTYEWKNAAGEVIGTNQTIALSQMGNYTLKIKTALGCESSHPFRLEVRDDLVKADVLSTAEAIAEDTVVFIDISRVLVDDPNNPTKIPDRIEWVYDANNPNIVRVGGYAGYTEELQFLKEGFYTLKMRAFYTSCSSEIEKSIVILPKAAKNATQNGLGYQGADVTEFTAFPNPSAGTFQAQVKLNKQANVSISLYSLQESRSLVTYTGENQQEYLFNFSLREDIPAGIYALMVISPNETRFFRVVIQK